MMDFEELTPDTRDQMWREFLLEEASGAAYRGANLSPAGRKDWPGLIEVAIKETDERWLQRAVALPAYWMSDETYERNGKELSRAINLSQASERLAVSEFNTWYVRGLAGRLLGEGVESCEVYRAGDPKWTPADCAQHEGLVVAVEAVYDGHRARYWPAADRTAFSVPFQPGCHHSIRRVS